MQMIKAKELLLREIYNSIYRYTNLLPNPDAILRKTGRGFDVYRQLKNDPHVWSYIQSRKSGVLSLDFELQQEGSSNEIFNTINKMFDTIDIY